jgi:hypothetical protein
MVNNETVIDRPIAEDPGNAVGWKPMSMNFDLPVALEILHTSPEPASIIQFATPGNFAPKAFNKSVNL